MRVADNGPGLGKLLPSQAFSPRVLGASGRSSVGLAICRDLAQEMGAEISLTSSDVGTEVLVKLRPA